MNFSKLLLSLAASISFVSSVSAATYQIDITADGFSSSFSISTDSINCYSDNPSTTGCATSNSRSLNSGAVINQLTYEGLERDVSSERVTWQSTDGVYQTTNPRSNDTLLVVTDDIVYQDANVSVSTDTLNLVYLDRNDFFGNGLISGVKEIQVKFGFRSYCDVWREASGLCSFPVSDTSGPFDSSDAVLAMDSIWSGDLINTYDSQNGLAYEETTPFEANTLFAYSLGVTVVFDDYSTLELSNASASMSNLSAVPVPAAVWLFGSGLIGLAGLARCKKA